MTSRRTFLGVLGISPIAAPAAIQSAAIGAMETAPSAGLATPAAASRVNPREILRRAVQLGLVSPEDARIAAEEEIGLGQLDYLDARIDAYKSFSAATKVRMKREARRDKGFEKLMAGEENSLSFWHIVERIRGKVAP